MEATKDIEQLQLYEQNLSAMVQSRQSLQAQLMEVDSALRELKGKTKAYRILGNVMVEATPDRLSEDLQEKRRLTELRIKSIEKQEEQLREKAKALQTKVLKVIKDEGRTEAGE